MADLLECLIQVGALRHTAQRLAASALVRWKAARDRGGMAGEDDPISGAFASIAGHERVFQDWLALVLPRGPSLMPPPRAPNPDADLGASLDGLPPRWRRDLEAFLARRAANLRVLGYCSAEDFAASAPYPGRGRITLADAVAIVLAHDTEAIGEIRAAAR